MHPILTPLSILGLESPALEILCLLALSLLTPSLWFFRKWKIASNASARNAEMRARNRLSYRIVQAHLDKRLDELLANLLSMQYDLSEIRAQGSLNSSPVLSVDSCRSGHERKGRDCSEE